MGETTVFQKAMGLGTHQLAYRKARKQALRELKEWVKEQGEKWRKAEVGMHPEDSRIVVAKIEEMIANG